MINKWLEKFESSWKAKDIISVLELFTDDVEYWETPFKKVNSKTKLIKEWSEIDYQENLIISMNVFSSDKNKHTIIWNISYDKEAKKHVWSGIYLIVLNDKGLCEFFQQVGEKK